MRSGDELSFRVTAYDEDGQQGDASGRSPSDDQPDTRPPLQFRFSMASVGHAEALRLVGSNEPLISEVVTIDPELERGGSDRAGNQPRHLFQPHSTARAARRQWRGQRPGLDQRVAGRSSAFGGQPSGVVEALAWRRSR